MALCPLLRKYVLSTALERIGSRVVGTNCSVLRSFTTENNEVQKARKAAATIQDIRVTRPATTIFGRILSGEIPAKIFHEDEKASSA